MENHIRNVEKLLSYTHSEIESKQVIAVLGEKIHNLVGERVIGRDIQNFIAYLKFVLSAPVLPKKLFLDIKVVRHFIGRTYVGFEKKVQDARAEELYKFITNRVGEKAEINDTLLSKLDDVLRTETAPSFEKLKDYVAVALLLKWFNGALKNRLPKHLEDYVIYLATVFGQLQSDRVLNVEYEIPKISDQDEATLAMEYVFFETALMDCIQIVKKSIKESDGKKPLHEQFRMIFACLDRLISNDSGKKSDELSSFRDKLLVSAVLIYLQDEFVVKDPEVSKLVDLFVSMYYRFRDKRYGEK